uniref:Uncharacterized protein n=1 Tax=Rhizophora mucronata TaxID=61149 RepID=A0A2P2NLB2_RHIMU
MHSSIMEARIQVLLESNWDNNSHQLGYGC